MDTKEKERLIASISWEYTPATVITLNKTYISLLLRSPTPKEQAKSAIVYNNEYRRSIIKGLQTEDSIIENMIIIGNWSRDTDIQIDGLYKDIHNIRRGLLDLLFNRNKLEQARSLLRRAESALLERLIRKQNLVQNSAEAYALICQQRYLISCITEHENGNSFWQCSKDFDEFNDIGIILQLCDIFFDKSNISINVIRGLARSQQWRSYWEISKKTNSLFNGCVTSWSSNQKSLSYWSTIYDSVYESYDRPSKDIIDDDDLLDSWFIRQGEKTESKVKENLLDKPLKSGRNEEFIMADKDGAKYIYGMNDPMVRTKIKARQKILNKHGVVRDQDMPDSQMDMKQQLSEAQRKHVKNIGQR